MTELDDPPALRAPVLIAAFEGWNDAGGAATACVEHLQREWGATGLTTVDPDNYYDFQVNRPTIAVDESGVRTLRWPTTSFSIATPADCPRDIVLVHGIEPNMRWRDFCAELLTIAAQLDVEQIMMLGALLADVPHTRPVPVTISTTDPSPAKRYGLEPSKYEGPTGILGVLQDAGGKAGLDISTLWAAVPHYVAQTACPAATLVLLQHVDEILGLPVPLGDLPEQAENWQQNVDEVAAEDEDITDYIHRLEEARDAADLPEASGEHIAREFERYLRRRNS